MSFTEAYGDLFDLPDSISLAHCVAMDFHMGEGIAKLFLQKFGSKLELRSRNIQEGEMTYLNYNNRFIYYLVTKRTSWSKPTYESFESSLVAMFEHLASRNIDTIGMPKIGCCLDGLDWPIVRDLIKKHQGNVNVIVRYFN